MDEAQKKFLEKNFPAGEYSVVSIMVRNDDLDKFIEHLKKSNLNLAVIPGVQAKMDFANPNKKGTEQ